MKGLEMITIATCNRGERVYDAVCEFAVRIYRNKHKIYLSDFPDTFAFARQHEKIIGCFGIYDGKSRDQLLIESYMPYRNILAELSKGNIQDRSALAEIGMRAVCGESVQGRKSVMVSVSLTIELLILARRRNIQYVAFTANRSVRLITKTIEAELIDLGAPDLSQKDATFMETWGDFFSVQQRCWALSVTQAVVGCQGKKQYISNELGCFFQSDSDTHAIEAA